MNKYFCHDCGTSADSYCSHEQTTFFFCDAHAQQHLKTCGPHFFNVRFNALTDDQLSKAQHAIDRIRQLAQAAIHDQVAAMHESVQDLVRQTQQRRRACSRAILAILRQSEAKIQTLADLISKGWDTFEPKPAEQNAFAEWVDDFIREEKLSRKKAKLRLEAQREFNEAQVHRELGLHHSAIPQYQECIRRQRELDAKEDLALSLERLGLTQYNHDEHNLAVFSLQESADLYSQLNFKQEQARTLYWLGFTLGRLNENNSAISVYEQSANIQKALGLRQDRARTIHDMGNSLHYTGNSEAGRTQFEETIMTRKSIRLNYGLALARECIGIISFDMEDYRSARKYLQSSCKIFSRLKVWERVGCDLNFLVATANHLHLVEEAKAYHHQLLQLNIKR